MEDQHIVSQLRGAGLRVTQSRREVLRYLYDAQDQALSSGEIEEGLVGLDRITLYRILKTYEEVGLIHSVADRSGKTKYAICSEGCTPGNHHHNHVHFYCRICDATTCLDLEIPATISVPDSYVVEDVQLVVSGKCNNCQN